MKKSPPYKDPREGRSRQRDLQPPSPVGCNNFGALKAQKGLDGVLHPFMIDFVALFKIFFPKYLNSIIH